MTEEECQELLATLRLVEATLDDVITELSSEEEAFRSVESSLLNAREAIEILEAECGKATNHVVVT